MSYEIRVGDAPSELPLMDAGSIQCCITSPPYFGLRDYGNEAQIGLEATPDAYVAKLVGVFREVKRVLRHDGTLWLNLGDSYAANRSYQVSDGKHLAHDYGESNATVVPTGMKPKDLMGVPWMVAFALRADGWYLRSEIIWAKPSPMPESVTDRPTKAHEQVFLLSKSARYFYDADAIREAHGRNKRSVWTVATRPYPEAHFATFPPKLIEPMVLAGCPRDGVVLDPFAGSGTTLQVAVAHGRSAIGIELNPAYAALAERRLEGVTPSMFDLGAAA